jgi:hypothetical protein
MLSIAASTKTGGPPEYKWFWALGFAAGQRSAISRCRGGAVRPAREHEVVQVYRKRGP